MTQKSERGFYAGGMAEFVTQPSDLTYQYLQRWFTGNSAYGRAMEILGLPCVACEHSVLVRRDGELLVDLSVEEATVYASTVFVYRTQTDVNTVPSVALDWHKCLRPSCWWGTWRLLAVQTSWLAGPYQIVARLQETLTNLPAIDPSSPDQYIQDQLLPVVITIGLVSEYLTQALASEWRGEELTAVQNYISQQIAATDWFFASIAARGQVKNGTLTLRDYLRQYGERADRDFELTLPRWQETPEKIAAEINKQRVVTPTTSPSFTLPALQARQKELVDAVIAAQLLRTQAKKQLLHAFALLRQSLGLTRTQKEERHVKPIASAVSSPMPASGQGLTVFAGQVTGQVFNFGHDDTDIPAGDIIGIFPNASPEFASEFTRCQGLIFQRGGQTSHGAIVAREFGIPALIDPRAVGIPDGSRLQLDAGAGVWRLL